MNTKAEIIEIYSATKQSLGFKIRTKCHSCGETFTSPLFQYEQLDRYQNGAFAQDAFPEWSPADRELFLISGTCGKCFDRIMAEPDEDEEE